MVEGGFKMNGSAKLGGSDATVEMTKRFGNGHEKLRMGSKNLAESANLRRISKKHNGKDNSFPISAENCSSKNLTMSREFAGWESAQTHVPSGVFQIFQSPREAGFQ